DAANVHDFIKTYKPAFPVGEAAGLNALEYLQWPPSERPLVPIMVFNDHKEMIRAQFTGADAKLFDDGQEKNIREQAAKLLNEGAAPAKKTAKRKTPAK